MRIRCRVQNFISESELPKAVLNHKRPTPVQNIIPCEHLIEKLREEK